MTNKELRRVLEAGRLPTEPDETMAARIRRTQAVLHALPIRRRAPTRAYSLLRQLETQARYVPKWFYVLNLLFLALSLALSVRPSFSDSAAALYALFPLLLLPYGLLLRRTFLSDMLELESACKYSISRTLAMRFFVLGCTTILAALLAFLPLSLLRFAGIVRIGYHLPRVLAALVDFTVTAALILFCGLRHIRWGLLAGGVWYLLTPALSHFFALPIGLLACLLGASMLLFIAAVFCRARLPVRLDEALSPGGN